jgi:hypothetical protein
VAINYKHRIAWRAIIETHHIPHRVSLKAKLLLEVKEYVFYLLLGKWDIAFGSPCGIGLTASVILRCAKVAKIGCRRAPTVEGLCRRTQALAIDIMVRVCVRMACDHE